MKKTLSVFLGAVLAALLISCDSGSIHTPADAEDYIGKSCEDVVSELKEAGFTNVQTTAVEDLTSAEAVKDGTIDVITICDMDSFSANDEFLPDAKILISYHTIKKAKAPFSSENIQGITAEKLRLSFANAGFTNISITEEYDLDPDTTDSTPKNEILINGTSTFSAGDNFPFDTTISIACHYPYDKYTVKVHIDFDSNLIFSTYDVDFLIDGEKQDTLAHGKDADYEFRLKEGEHTFAFVNAESASVKGEIALNITCDVDASYNIHCYNDRVEVGTVFIDYKKELADNEAKIMCAESSFWGTDYQEVVAALEELGFTNIKAIPRYDIYFGITQAGSTASVTIGGSKEYKRGDGMFIVQTSFRPTYRGGASDGRA